MWAAQTSRKRDADRPAGTSAKATQPGSELRRCRRNAAPRSPSRGGDAGQRGTPAAQHDVAHQQVQLVDEAVCEKIVPDLAATVDERVELGDRLVLHAGPAA